MSNTEQVTEATVQCEHIGGIESTEVTLRPGVTILTGRNATNRTSFLRSLMAALGSERVSLKSDTKRGSVELNVKGRTYTRQIARTGDTLTFDGDPYLDDSTTADLFAFLLASNEARQAVVTEADLREVIMRPVDTEAIEDEIARLRDERDRVEREIENLDSLEAEIRQLKSRQEELRGEIADLEAEREEFQSSIDEAEQTVDDQQEQKTELEDVVARLRDARSDLEETRFRLDTERESLQSLRDEQTTLEEKRESLETIDVNTEELTSRTDRLRGQIDELDSSIRDLQAVIEYNTEVLRGKTDVASQVSSTSTSDGAVTDQLVGSDSITCWTCGTDVDRRQIESTTDQLRELVDDRRSRRSELQTELEELERELTEARNRRENRDDVESRLDTVETEIESRKETIEDLKDDRERLVSDVEALEREADTLRDETQSDLLDAHRELSEVEFKIDQRRDELENIAQRRETKRRKVNEREELEATYEELSRALTEERTRIDDIESKAVDAFNQEMETVLGLLEYTNVERVWLERVERTVQRGRRKVEETEFDLHVVRESSGGTVYEDTVHHLSESERKVVGLVFALAGYLVHDVHEQVPFMLLDSLEAVDASRIASLIDHFEQFSTFLVVALLPEDAEALDDEYERVDW